MIPPLKGCSLGTEKKAQKRAREPCRGGAPQGAHSLSSSGHSLPAESPCVPRTRGENSIQSHHWGSRYDGSRVGLLMFNLEMNKFEASCPASLTWGH